MKYADAFRERFAGLGFVQSMNRPREIPDNAHMESFHELSGAGGVNQPLRQLRTTTRTALLTLGLGVVFAGCDEFQGVAHVDHAGAFALVLRHPVTLLVLTAIFTGVLAPRITGMWQDRAKQLEIKARLVEEIALAMETYFSRLQLLELKGAAAAVSLDDALGDWRTKHAVIEAKVAAYFPKNEKLHRQWGEIGASLWALYFLLRNETPQARLRIWNESREYFGGDAKNFKTLIDTPIGKVGDRLASYDVELQRLLDRYRYKRAELLEGLLRANLSLR